MIKQRITREQILDAAAELVREEGAGALNARAVARKLKCSTQPVYSRFENMDALRAALFEEGKARYRRFIERYSGMADCGYESYGLGFVRFAREERGFYRMLFLDAAPLDVPFLEEIIGEMMSSFGMTEETARAFHADMSVFSVGLASMVSAGAELSDEAVRDAFRRQFYALYAYYFPSRPRFWEEV